MGKEERGGADVELRLGGQQLNVKNVKSLNTLATIATLLIVAAVAAGGYAMFSAHAAETKDASRELVTALKEMTQAVREANCISTRTDPEICRRLSR